MIFSTFLVFLSLISTFTTLSIEQVRHYIPGGYYGRSVSMSNNHIIIGFPDDQAWIYERDTSLPPIEWNFKQPLSNPDTSAQYYGNSVSVSGNYAIVGAYGNYGKAFIYERDSSLGYWIRKQTLSHPTDTNYWHLFGNSVSISGNFAIVGVPSDDTSKGIDSGSAFVYERDTTGTWNRVDDLVPSNGAAYDYTGFSVSITSGTNDVFAIVSSHGNGAGKAIIYERDSTTGKFDKHIEVISEFAAPTDGDNFGFSVSISNDIAIVGARDDDNSDGDQSGSAYIFERNDDGSWSQKKKLVDGDGEVSGAYCGYSVAIENNIAMVGCTREDSKGAVHFYEKGSDGEWSHTKLTDSSGNEFGSSVALSNNFAIIGDHGAGQVFIYSLFNTEAPTAAPTAATDPPTNAPTNAPTAAPTPAPSVPTHAPTNAPTAVNSGEVIDITNEDIKLLPSTPGSFDDYGQSVSISNNYAIIGAPKYDSNGIEYSGKVFVYEADTTTTPVEWNTATTLDHPDPSASDYFGFSVSISGDYAIIGAPIDNVDYINDGSAFIYERDTSGTWNYEQTLVDPIPADDGKFGYSVSISGDFAIVGVPQDGENGINSGTAFIYERDSTSGTWKIVNHLIPCDGEQYNYFGWSVSITSGTNGVFAMIGAIWNDDHGSVYVYERDSTTERFRFVDKISPSDGSYADRFGHSISISNDMAIVGARTDDNSNGEDSGSAYIFERNNNNGKWSQTAKLVANYGTDSDVCGYSVSIDNDDNIAMVGCPRGDSNTGNVLVFEKDIDSGVWSLTRKITASDRTSDEFFGGSVAVSNDFVVVGAKIDYDDSGVRCGSAYIYSL